MSAAEKLQRWYEYEIDGARGEALMEHAVEEMQRIRKQIVAVVEAAEHAYAILGPRIEMPCSCDGCDCENGMAAAELVPALAALDKALP